MNIIDRYFCVQIFLWFYIFFVLQLPTLSDFCEWILFFTISDAGLDWQVQTHEFYGKSVSYQRSKEHVASLKTSCISSGLNSAGASNLQKCFSKIHRCESHRFEYRGVAKRPPGHPDPGAQPASTISVRRVIPWHSRKPVMHILYRAWWVGLRGWGAWAWSVQHIALFLTCI